MRSRTAVFSLFLLVATTACSLFYYPAFGNFVGLYMPKTPPPAPVVKILSPPSFDQADAYAILNFGFTFSVHVEPWISDYGDPRFGDYDANHVYTPLCTIKVLFNGKVFAEPKWINDAPISIILNELDEGSHTVEVVATVTGQYSSHGGQTSIKSSSSGQLTFEIVPLKVDVLTEREKTFAPDNVQVNFAITRRPLWISYNIDQKGNFSINLAEALTSTLGKFYYTINVRGANQGSHSLIVYAQDAAGKSAASQPFVFNVENPEPPLEITTHPTESPTPSPHHPTSPPSSTDSPPPAASQSQQPSTLESYLPSASPTTTLNLSKTSETSASLAGLECTVIISIVLLALAVVVVAKKHLRKYP